MIEIYFLCIAGISCTFAIFSFLYKTYKIHRKINVNCWFCNKDTRVTFESSNSFICPFCEQYNGFKEDGSYNCIIPAQHSEKYSLKLRDKYQKFSSYNDSTKFENGFCEPCNLNQALKIRAISEFSAGPSTDSIEFDKFKARLEEIYHLCQPCHAVLHQTIGKQNSWLKPQLISWRIRQSKEKVLKIASRKKLKPLLCHFLQSLSLATRILVCVFSLEEYFPQEFLPFEAEFVKSVSKVDVAYLHLLYFGVVLQGGIFLLQDEILKVKNFTSFFGWSLLLLVEKFECPISPVTSKDLKVILSFFNLFFISWISRQMAPNRSYSDCDDSSKLADYSQDSPFLSNSVGGNKYQDLHSSLDTPSEMFVVEQRTPTKKEQELDADLLTLKISTPKKNSSKFLPQNLFMENSSTKTAKLSYSNLIQPSKFGKQFITEASWVAGGYWGSPGSPQRDKLTSKNVSDFNRVKPKPVFSLSRSSSQSSGFISQFSECASSKSQSNAFHSLPKQSHSQQSSLAGDPIERGSVYSWGHIPRNGASSFSSLRNHNLDNFEAHSACSATSFYSDNSQLHLRKHSPSAQSGPIFYDAKPTIVSDNTPQDRNDRLSYTNTTTVPSYFNVGLAFILGISVSANVFLIIILSQYKFL